MKPEEFLETKYLWAVFSKNRLVCFSLMGPPTEGRWKNHCDDLEHISIDISETPPGTPFQGPSNVTNEEKLAQETNRFLNTGNHHMPLDFLAFTPFQQKVFTEVMKVRPGTTTTYKEIATQLGNPKAARAVGAAISRNPFAYFLPTHRILPSSGELGTCTSGAGHLKGKLLENEMRL